MKSILRIFYVSFATVLMLTSCRGKEPVQPDQEDEPVAPPVENPVYEGFYVLNQGNMGSNKASLDYFSYTTGVYSRNIYPTRNPGIVKELGDVGNDLQIYGAKMYAVINCSNLVEVMDAATGVHITAITIPNCRYIAFHDGKAYVTSYAGAKEIGDEEIGYVAEIDTTTLTLTGRQCYVGYNPDGIAVLDGKAYVANSGGYLQPVYDNRLSVIDLASMTEVKKIKLLTNMDRVVVSSEKMLYITSRGNYSDFPEHDPPIPYMAPTTVVFDPKSETIVKDLGIPASNICISGDSCYLMYSDFTNQSSYKIVNTKTLNVVSDNFIKDGTGAKIIIPYAIAVYRHTGEFMVGDATDFVSPGVLYYFNADGTLKWKTDTGDIPACIAFLKKQKIIRNEQEKQENGQKGE